MRLSLLVETRSALVWWLLIARKVERIGEIMMACLILFLTLPLMLFAALAIKCETAGPVLESEACVGRAGQRFQKLRFRTAVYDPFHSTPIWARRPTPIGRILWQTRIDALPELLNVLHGDMSIFS